VNGPALRLADRLVGKIDRFAQHIQHTAEGLRTHRHADGFAQIQRGHPALQTIGGLHGDGAHAAFSQVLLDFRDDVDGDPACGVSP
jgi:hypothetical protein